MTLPPYTRIREGEVHSRGLGVRSCAGRARSRPLSEPGESIERACEGTSAQGTAGQRIPWVIPPSEQPTYTKDVVTRCDPLRFTHTAVNMLHRWPAADGSEQR